MRTIINLITIAFVMGAVVFAFENPALQKAAKGYWAEGKSELSQLTGGKPVSLSLKSVTDSFSNLMNIGQESTDAQIPQSVTPGPLTKISTDGSTTQPVSQNPAPVTTSSGTAVRTQLPAHALLSVEGIISQTNLQRNKNSVASLSESTQLDASAQVKAQDILTRQYFEHTAPDGKTVSDLVGAQGYTYIKIGENLALGNFTSDADVVTAWMNSPGHRANIVDSEFQQMGVGVAYGTYQGHSVYVAVQHFGKPSTACPTISAALKSQVENGQASLTKEATALQSEKAAIDTGKSQGFDMSQQVSAYNAGVDKYQADYTAVEAIRIQYNAQVVAYNQCIGVTN